jgi:negative regulator of replication initiation
MKEITYTSEEVHETLHISPALRAYLKARRLPRERDEDLLWRLLDPPRDPLATAKGMELEDYVSSAPFLAMTQLTERYLHLLAFCNRQDARIFEHRVSQIRKRQRVYFASSREEIERSGVSTQPRLIPDSDLWALTNMRRDRKVEVLDRVLRALDYPEGVRQRVITKVVSRL